MGLCIVDGVVDRYRLLRAGLSRSASHHVSSFYTRSFDPNSRQYRITRHRHSIEQATAAWLLPVVAPIVASSVGHVVADVLAPHSQSHALLTSTVSLFLVLLGLGLVFMMLPLYLFRLVTHGLPASGLIISCFLPLGPCGQGGYSLLLAADLFPMLLRGTASPFFRDESAFTSLRVVLIAGAFCLWTFGTMWLVMACAAVYEIAARNHLAFALPWWGVVSWFELSQ